MKRIDGIYGRATCACALALLLAFAGCEQSGESTSSGDATQDVPTGEPDVPTPDASEDVVEPDVAPDVAPDVPGPDVVEPPVDASDVSDVVDPDGVDPELPDGDATEPPVDPEDEVALSCETDDDCTVSCATGGICNVEQECVFAHYQGCLIPDATGDVATCYEAGAAAPDGGCLFCNPKLAPTAWSGSFAREDFEGGLGAFKNVVQLESGSDANWVHSQARAATGIGSLYFGDPENMTYDVDGQAHAQVYSQEITVPEGTTLSLSFDLWLDTEAFLGYDLLSVMVRQDGETAQAVWNSDVIEGSTHGVFVPFHLSLEDLGGSTVQIGFDFDTFDGLDNGYEGVYIDDISVTAGCCGVDEDCHDANPCTLDQCSGDGTCSYEALDACCLSDEDCDDDDACTLDTCSGFGGTCEQEPLEEGCCETAADCPVPESSCSEESSCADGGSCSLAQCVDGACAVDTIDCCVDDGACDDGNGCTVDQCVDGSCSHEVLEGCCTDDAACDDGDACTSDTCADQVCVHAYTCCTSDAACNDGEYCTIDKCENGACTHAPAILPGCCSPEIESQNFEGAGVPFGWTGAAAGGVGWTVADVGESQSGSKVLYYGNPETMNYDDGTANQGTITTQTIYIPAGLEASLSFKAYMDVETASWADQLTVKIIAESNTVTVASKSNLTIKGWKTFTTDISYLAGQAIKISFTFETTSSSNNTGLGVLIDDLLVGSTCEPKACDSNAVCSSLDSCLAGVCAASVCTYVNNCCYADDECDDEQVCTIDSCAGGKCNFAAIEGCCEDLDDCSDGNACTTDICSGYGGTCSWEDVPGCCLTHADCDDVDGCTQDKCVDNACENLWICCADDSECDDFDDVCTTDVCLDQFCAFEPTGVEGCCETEPLVWDFETPISLEVTNSSNPCTWQILSSGQNQTLGGSQVLYYGDASANNFDCGANSGTAVTETFSLQDGVDYTLSFKLMMDTETSTSYDKLFLYALSNGQEIEFWSKAKLNYANKGVWVTYETNFSAFAGQDVALKFYFNTVDSVLNATPGVFMDDIKITSTCLPAPCSGNGDCDDGLNSTTATCSSGNCVYSIP